MFLVIINTILDSVSDIIYKKTLAMSDIKPTVFQFAWELLAVPVVLIIMLFNFNFSLFFNPIIVGGFAFLSVVFVLQNNLGQYLYKNEKLSSLLPYQKINSLIVVIAGFLIFRDSSATSFLICIGAIILATVTSIDWKDHKLPKNFWIIILQEMIQAVELMTSVYILKQMTDLEYIVIYQLIYVAMIAVFVIFSGEWREFKKFTPKLAGYRTVGYMIGLGSYFIDIFLLKEFGVIIATLFGFFWSAIELVLAYFLLKEVPEKKEIVPWVVMIILAGVGYYFR